ncbi:MAG: hypothetical protein WAN48_15610 [Actinomycetes bacterium]
MDASRVLVLRELLATTSWVERTRGFARTMRTSTHDAGGLLLVGTPDEEPWHLAAHLDDESRLTGVPQLRPTLIRYRPPADAPPHLSVTLQRLESAGRGETIFVVAEDQAPESLLQRAWDARKTGATVLALDTGDAELESVAHESLIVPGRVAPPDDRVDLSDLSDLSDLGGFATPDLADILTFDSVQHLVSVAAGEVAEPVSRRGLRDRLSRMLDAVSGPRHVDHDH